MGILMTVIKAFFKFIPTFCFACVNFYINITAIHWIRLYFCSYYPRITASLVSIGCLVYFSWQITILIKLIFDKFLEVCAKNNLLQITYIKKE